MSSCNYFINMRTHRWPYGPCFLSFDFDVSKYAHRSPFGEHMQQRNATHSLTLRLLSSGKYPHRVESPVVNRYRIQEEQARGFFVSNKEEWWRVRQPVNKVMMRSNAALPYLDLQSPIGDELVEMLKKNFREGNGKYPMIMKVNSRESRGYKRLARVMDGERH